MPEAPYRYRIYKQLYCFVCGMQTSHKRVFGEGLTCPCWRCNNCQIEVVIELKAKESHEHENGN